MRIQLIAGGDVMTDEGRMIEKREHGNYEKRKWLQKEITCSKIELNKSVCQLLTLQSLNEIEWEWI